MDCNFFFETVDGAQEAFFTVCLPYQYLMTGISLPPWVMNTLRDCFICALTKLTVAVAMSCSNKEVFSVKKQFPRFSKPTLRAAEGTKHLPHLWDLCTNEIVVRVAKHILKWTCFLFVTFVFSSL